MSRITRRSRYAVATLCAFTLIAAACGDDDDEGGDATEETAETADTADTASATSTEAPATTEVTSTTEPAATEASGTDAPATTTAAEGSTAPAAPTGDPIKIGLVYSETGRTALTYGMTDGVAKAWAEWSNTEMGGVAGHPVEIVLADGQSTGEGALAAANELIAEGVVGIIVQDSTAENAIAEAITAAGIPMIGGTANGRPQDTGDAHWPNTYFVTSPSNPATAASTMIATKAAGLTSYSAAVCAEVPACAEAGRLYEIVGPAIGVEYNGLVTVGAADPSYTAACLELVSLGADVINLGLAPQTAVAVIEECQLQGFTGAYSSANNSVTAPDLEGLGVRVIGGLNGFPWWADDPQVETYRTVNEDYGDGEDIRNSSATSTWSALELFRKTFNNSGLTSDDAIDAATVISTYQGISGETLDGLLAAPVSYVAEGFQPALQCFWLFDMGEDGTFTSIVEGESGNGVEGDLQTTCFSLG
jgi:branched-chain amino acid transport system substrate-binding protein